MSITVKCKACLKELSINAYNFKASKTKNFYCNHSCRAKTTNKGRKHTVATKNKIRTTLALVRPKKTWFCVVCNNVIKTKRFRKTCSTKCLLERNKITGRQGGMKTSQSPFTKRGRSRNEINMYEQLLKHFPKALHNKRMFGEFDADIIIEELKVAIHWNGPLHYKALFGEALLVNIQKRDLLRYEAIEQAGYTNWIIDDANNTGYNPNKVQEELNRFLKWSA